MTQIPPEVMDAVEIQTARLALVWPPVKAELLAIAEQVERDLEERLRELAGSPERYTTQEVRVALAQVRATVDGLGALMGTRLGDALTGLGREAARVGRDGLLEQIGAWADTFRGSVRRIAPVELASDLLSNGLLDYFEASRETWGQDRIAKMRASLARSVQSAETWSVAAVKLREAVGMEPHQAERIVRTEATFAMHARQFADIAQVYGPAAGTEMRKQLVATFDNRTGEDSVFVDGQERALGKPFEDNAGRVYQFPPNRPQDREVVVYIPPGVGDATGDAVAAAESVAPTTPALATPARALPASVAGFAGLDVDREISVMARAMARVEEDPSDAQAQLEVRAAARRIAGLPENGRGSLRIVGSGARAAGSSDGVGNISIAALDDGQLLSDLIASGDASQERADLITTIIHEETHAAMTHARHSGGNWVVRNFVEESTTEEYAQWVMRDVTGITRARVSERAQGIFGSRANSDEAMRWTEKALIDPWSHGAYADLRESMRKAVMDTAADVGVAMAEPDAVQWIVDRRRAMIANKEDIPIVDKFTAGARIGGRDVGAALLEAIKREVKY